MPLRLLIMIATLSWATSTYADTLKVVASIKPVHSLTAAIMGDLGEPTLLISGGASPHTYSLKPSHAMALAKADLIVWVGPELERFLKAPLANLASTARSLPLLRSPGLTLLDARAGGIWSDPHNHHEASSDAQGHTSNTLDPHVWLDIANAIVMANAIEAALIEIYPEHTETFKANANDLRTRLNDLDEEIASMTAPIATHPYFVFHDAYQYFEKRYGLSPLGALTASPDIRPGARRLSDLRKVGDRQARICVFAEPQFEPRLLTVLTEHNGAQLAYLDPLGSDLEAGPEQYLQTLHTLASNLVTCLQAH